MSALQTQIVAEIGRVGPLPFSTYMELALYHPELGFYADGGAGRRRDFITSPEVGPLFGAVVARAIDAWWDQLGRPDQFTFVDAGAGPGSLARAILRCDLRCKAALESVAVETSTAQRDRHPDNIVSLDTMPERVECGVIFANELLDNLPFDIESWDVDAKQWSEIRVGSDGDRLVEVAVPIQEPLLVLGQGATGYPDHPVRTPIHRRARVWWQDAIASLGEGWLVAIDYGSTDGLWPNNDDWLRTYSQHGRAGLALDDPGTKDITTDVYWQQVTTLGDQPRVGSCTFDTQAGWLDEHGIAALVEAGSTYWDSHAAAPDLKAIEMRSRTNEAGALLDPAGLGAFDVATFHVAPDEPESSR